MSIERIVQPMPQDFAAAKQVRHKLQTRIVACRRRIVCLNGHCKPRHLSLSI
jgi:hypothetical protein